MAVSAPAPKSTHVSDPTLKPFLQPTFDPADYLNATLPSLSLSSASSRSLKQGQSATLADLSSQTQDLLSQLNTHTTRLSTILAQLTDDILRSGGRLAYEVEVLRGETIGLTETLTEGLKDDVIKFIPEGLSVESKKAEEVSDKPEQEASSDPAPPSQPPSDSTQEATQPPHITQLATLHTIRSRLESVIRIFGEAMHWTLPPSEVSLTSSLITVTPSTADADLETRGRDFAASLRSEISDLITGSEDSIAGAEAAAERIQALRELAQVWKGTAEEKARVKFVEGLVKLAEEKGNVWNARREKEQQQRASGRGRSESGAKREAAPPPVAQKSGGFLDNLQRLREGIL